MTGSNTIPIKHRIIGFYHTVKNKIMWFGLYQKTYSNFLSVTLSDLKGNYPIKAIFRNNSTKNLGSKDEVALHALLTGRSDIKYDEQTDSAIFDISKLNCNLKKIELFGIKQNLDAILAFEEGTYENLPLKNTTVIDIGACTGDSSIYFAIHGAKKVIAIEPYPKNFQMLKKNVEVNNFSEIINPKLAGCSSKSSQITIDPDYNSSMRSHLQEFEMGVDVPLITLSDILKTEKISNGILKLDCEGCEYDAIMNSPNELLKKFSHIQIEYHDGYNNLKKKLEECGFFVYNIIIDTSKRGHILAVREKRIPNN